MRDANPLQPTKFEDVALIPSSENCAFHGKKSQVMRDANPLQHTKFEDVALTPSSDNCAFHGKGYTNFRNFRLLSGTDATNL